jgi:hypothetical protein
MILNVSLETGTVGSIVGHIEIAGFIVFGCLSTFHPLLTRFISRSAKEKDESNSFSAMSEVVTESSNDQRRILP